MIKLHTVRIGDNIIIPQNEFGNFIQIISPMISENIEVIEEKFSDLRKYSELSFNNLWDNTSDEVWNDYL